MKKVEKYEALNTQTRNGGGGHNSSTHNQSVGYGSEGCECADFLNVAHNTKQRDVC